MIVAGCNLVSSFDPQTGAKLWEIEGATEECVVTPVTDGERVFTSGGYPKNHTMAVLADGSGKVLAGLTGHKASFHSAATLATRPRPQECKQR